MNKYIDADQLKAEIEKQLASLNGRPLEMGGDYIGGLIDAFSRTITFINSIQQEHPSLPSNLDEVAEETAKGLYLDRHNLIWMFKAGAKWMAGQGETIEGEVMKDIDNNLCVTAKGFSGKEAKFGDKVVVQIRKK